MPYICTRCGSEGRSDSESDVSYDAYTYYANCYDVDGCPNCTESSDPEKENKDE